MDISSPRSGLMMKHQEHAVTNKLKIWGLDHENKALNTNFKNKTVLLCGHYAPLGGGGRIPMSFNN